MAKPAEVHPPIRLSAHRRKALPALTSLRAFAALHVVVFHTLGELGGDSSGHLPTSLRALVSRGQTAVSFFFVLSGFILTYTYCSADGDMVTESSRFWRARFARIYPLYFLSFVLDAPRAIGYFVQSSPRLTVACVKAAVAAGSFVTLLQSWWPRVTNSWNTPGWSLSTEAFFYLSFPLLVRSAKKSKPSLLITVGLAAWALPLLAYATTERLRPELVGGPAFETWWRSFPPLRFPEFLLGVGIGRLFISWKAPLGVTKVNSLRLAALVASLLIGFLLSTDFGIPANLICNSLAAPLFATVIVALAANALPATAWLSLRPLPLLGSASYAVYILHQPVKTWFLLATRAMGIVASPGLLLTYVFVLEALCVVALSAIEEPARRWLTGSPRTTAVSTEDAAAGT